MRRVHRKYACVLFLCSTMAAQSATLFVATNGDDGNSGISASKPLAKIQTAINKAAVRNGPDVIQIAEGEYREHLAINDSDSVTLCGRPGVVIIAGTGFKDAVNITGGDVTLTDITVTGAKSAGIRAVGAANPIYLTLRRVTATLNGGRGMRAEDVLEVCISDCEFIDNQNDDGIKVVTVTHDPSSATLLIRNTLVSGNGDDGIDLELLGDIRLLNVVVQDNFGDDGLAIDDSASVFISGSMFLDNEKEGIDIDDTASITIVSSLSQGNGGAGVQIKSELDKSDLGEPTPDAYHVQSIQIVGSDFLDNAKQGVWILDEEAGEIQFVSLTSVTSTGNGGEALDITVTCPVKLAAITQD